MIIRILFLFFCFCISFCQEAAAIDTARYRFHVMPETSYYGGIQSITKDSLGRIWYTGPDAVFMYDGNAFNQLNDLVSASDPKSKWGYGTLLTDKQGRLFLTTNHGLLQMNYGDFSFDFVSRGKVRSLALNEDGSLYMLKDDSVLRYDPVSGQAKGFPLPKDSFFSNVICINGNAYCSTEGRLYKIDINTSRLVLFADLGATGNVVNDAVEFRGWLYLLTQHGGMFVVDARGNIQEHIAVPKGADRSVIAKKLYLDELGIMWIASQSGLFLYDPVKRESTLLKMKLSDSYSLPNNSIWTIYPDPDQGVWIGTYGGKFAYSSFYDTPVRYINPTPGGLNHPIISSFEEDKTGNIWIGTEGGGLNYWNRKDDSFQQFMQSQPNSVNANLIKSLRFDREKKQLFIAAFNGGITGYDINRKIFKDLGFYYPTNRQPLAVYNFVFDHQLAWWMTDPDRELFYKGPQDKSVRVLEILDKDNKALKLEIECLFFDDQRKLRLVTHQGFFVVDPQTRKVLQHYFLKDKPYAANNLCCYQQASNGDLWLGTLGGGLNVLKKDGSYLNFDVNNGFPAKMVFGILEDTPSQNIWLSTSEGLFCYNQREKRFNKAKFYAANQCGSFYIRSAYKTANGELLFGGTNGFVLFDPAHINNNPQKPRVFFTDFFVNNKRVTTTSADSLLSRDISSLANEKENKITLSSDQSNIEIRFSTNSYLNPEKNRFAYRMKGLSDKWFLVSAGQKSVQFFNLASGDYFFEIKAANNDRVWADEISKLYFHVNPPFFLSHWAYLLYILMVVGLLFFVLRYFTHKKMFKERLALEAVKEQNMLELNQARTDFFTHISHDLKTPLTLVVEPLKQLKETVSGNDAANGYMQLIEKNITRIQRMISQLLRFREIESQKITLHPQVGDIIGFIQDVFGLFELYANKKEIETNIIAHEEHLYTAFDYDVIEKILTNLFSNALKYTPNKGYVGVRIYLSTEEEVHGLRSALREDEAYLSIEVLNTGDGFSAGQVAALFTSFNRLSTQRPSFEESSGLGLAIVKQLVDVLQGKIQLLNKENKVSFIVTLPYTRETNVKTTAWDAYDYTISEIDNIMVETAETEARVKNVRKANSVLLIEDDPSMRTYLEQRLSEKFNIYSASDGVEGIVKAEKVYPQVIITDLMMPHASGFEVCKRIRQNFKTSHIPIVMISGLGEEHQNKLKALEFGASVFIDKPFDIEYLMQQVESILKNQRELKVMYSKRFIVDPSNVTISSMDEELLQRAMKYIELNMSNPNYSVDMFVSDMNLGRTILYQKINDIVGMSIKEFILNVRLKRSAYLLEQSELTVAEIADKTGFNNAKYFSVCFKKQFEKSPSEFKRRTSDSSKM